MGFNRRLKTKAYIIEFNKLRFGNNELSIPINDELFLETPNKSFDDVIANCVIAINKKEHLYEMQFTINGTVQVTCDTCLDVFNLPLNKTYELLVKLIDGPENINDDEIIYLPKGLHFFDFKQFIYDYFLLAFPTKISCEDAGKEHNQAFVSKIQVNEGNEEKDNTLESDPRWDALKNIYNKN